VRLQFEAENRDLESGEGHKVLREEMQWLKSLAEIRDLKWEERHVALQK
jgi:hypothetical protein